MNRLSFILGANAVPDLVSRLNRHAAWTGEAGTQTGYLNHQALDTTKRQK
jgi:hypothetical protein